MMGSLESGVKQLPPPSMRLPKHVREHIISGAYQQDINNRQIADKPPRPSNPLPAPTSPRQPVPVVNQQANVAVPPVRPPSGLHVCVFCRNNGESESVYTSHVLKDSDGRTSCPILRAYTCPICKANNDSAHTIKYCPQNQNVRVPSSIGGVMGPPSQAVMGQRNYQPQRPASFRPPFPSNLATGRLNVPSTVKLRQ